MDDFQGLRGKFTEGEPVALMHKGFDLAVTLFDAADTYGTRLNVFANGRR